MRNAVRNGVIVKEEDAVLPVTLREVQYSFSIYEALRVKNGKAVHLDDHLKRLKESADAISLVHPFTDEEISSSLEMLLKHDKVMECTVRIFVLGGSQAQYFITYTDLLTYPDSYYEDGIGVTLYNGERFLPQAKTSNLLMQYIALEEAKKRGAFEALLVNRKSEILEGTRSNFYAISGSYLYTAPDELVLSGITRISVLKAAAKLGLTIKYLPPTLSNVYMLDSLFISSTSMGAMPVHSVNSIEVKRDAWPLIASIHKLVREWE